MYTDIPFWLSLVFMLGGLGVIAWSSDVFVDGAAAVAKALGISPFIIGMVIIGFGTSAPGERAFSPYLLTRDLPLMTVLSLSIAFFGINWRHPKWPGVISRREGLTWLAVFIGYTLLMFYQETQG